jgi:hypothetical protein
MPFKSGPVDDLRALHSIPPLSCALLLFAANAMHAATFDLGSEGTLSVDIPASWAITARPLGHHGYDLRFQPPSDEGPQICFTVIIPANGKVLDHAAADATFRDVAAEFAKDSVDQKPDIKEMKLANGFAFYASFTDPSLVGHAPVPGNWKTSTPCVMVLSGKIVVSATIFSDDLSTPDFAESLAVLWSARLEPRE